MALGSIIPLFVNVINLFNVLTYIHGAFEQSMLGLVPMIGIPLVMSSLSYIGHAYVCTIWSLANLVILWKYIVSQYFGID